MTNDISASQTTSTQLVPTDDPPTPVVVIGAGLGGTAAAAFLAHAGVPALVLERRDAPSRRPRARMVSARSQELLRTLGLADRVVELGEPGSYEIHIAATLSDAPVSDRELDPTASVSPNGAALLDQDLLEGLLREYAEEHGSEFRWGQEVQDIADGEGGAAVRTAQGLLLRARHVILAEGSRAELRTGLGIGGLATSEPDEFHEILFRSTRLDELMADRHGAGFVCTATGSNVLRRDLGRWTITRYGRPLTDPVADIAAAAGRVVDVEVLSEGTWRPSAALAARFRTGNVFLLGDAAHSMPPSVGMAGNLAIADAHNLAWKLAHTLAGTAGPALLDTYSADRRPAPSVVLEQAQLGIGPAPDRPLPIPLLQLGIGYPPATSSALASDDFEQPLVDPAVLTPRIGARLPHQWLADGRSTVDLTSGTDFVTIGSGAGTESPLAHHRIDTGADDDPQQVWIIRPDGHVAARVAPADVAATLDRLLDRRTA